uniref:Protein TsetseEP domain-containing protein n=1 Tax=Anopheles funestus TaxID=62324 RepID=A0A4Y0BLZ7_ANOFN
MKSFIVLLAIGIVAAGRPETEDVIITFKKLLPLYNSSLDEAQTVINTVKSDVMHQLAQVHLGIIDKKEAFVQIVIEREETIHQVIGAQRTADNLCLSFVNASSEMNVNLAGVSFTNCINKADEAINGNLASYYGYINTMEQQVSWIRLLDVFQGHNVFHSPQPIIDKLHAKMNLLMNNNGTASRLENVTEQVYNDLSFIQNNYNACMQEAFNLFEQGVNMCQMQMQLICGADLSVQN